MTGYKNRVCTAIGADVVSLPAARHREPKGGVQGLACGIGGGNFQVTKSGAGFTNGDHGVFNQTPTDAVLAVIDSRRPELKSPLYLRQRV